LEITPYMSYWLQCKAHQHGRLTLVSHCTTESILPGHELELHRRGLPVATEAWQLSPSAVSLAIHSLFPESSPWVWNGHEGRPGRMARHPGPGELGFSCPPWQEAALHARFFSSDALRRQCCCRPWNAIIPWATLILLPIHQLCIMHAKVCGLRVHCVPGYNTK
jgi:hypothetical protein